MNRRAAGAKLVEPEEKVPLRRAEWSFERAAPLGRITEPVEDRRSGHGL